ncbi:hypothetical protein [Aquimarina aquimarini]|uniref:hypothetical protein n=1 Tax=Aquimarina aquimarini TaxID=1191734 RepID=UPI000D555DD8|nr:hypothetical protein [Aquimarina aquimarini]
MVDFTRPVTHTGYKNAEKLKKHYHRVYKQISEHPGALRIDIIDVDKADYTKEWYADDNFFNMPTAGTITPLWVGGVSYLVASIFIIGYVKDGTLKPFEIFLFVLSSLLAIFFTIYYFTKPKKERILNRKDGLITMTGVLWQKNITIPFKECLFVYSTGGEDGTGAYNLEAMRPSKSKFGTFADFNMGKEHCYQAISLVTWYMDKNRPLPPGRVFDACRDRDYERRKAAGFPRPLYPSSIATPEATKEQQAERKRIGGW